MEKKNVYLKVLAGNLNKYLWFKVLSGFVLFYVIDKIFMETRGLSVTEIVWVEIIYAATVIILEVPSGALADRWSRKNILAFNVIFFMGNAVVWALAPDFNWFVIGVMLGAVHSALRSGTDQSLFYDTLKELRMESSYEKIKGDIALYYGLVAMLAGILGGMVADSWGMEMTFWLTLIPAGLSLIFIFSMTEPRIHRSTGEIGFWRHMREAAMYLTKHERIYQLIFIGLFLGVAMTLVDEYMSLYFVRVGVPVFLVGYLVAVNDGLIPLGEKFGYLFKNWPRHNLYLIIIFLSSVGLFGAFFFHNWLGIICLFMPVLAYYSMQPIFNGDLNRQLASSHRSTCLSYMSLIDKLIIIPVGLLFGYLADGRSLFAAYGAVGVLIGLYLIYYWMFSRKIIRSVIIK